MSDTLDDLIEEFLAWQDGVRGLSAHSVQAYRRDLSQMVRILSAVNPNFTGSAPVCSVQASDLRSCIGQLSRDKKAASSINRFIAAVRNFFAYCRRFDYIKIDPAAELKTVKQPVRVPKFMNAAEVDDLCRCPIDNPLLWAERDNALFEMLYSSGCRVSEIAGIKLEDLSVLQDSALVRGKGGKDRRVFFSHDAVVSLKRYMQEREKRLRELGLLQAGKNPAALFINWKGTNLSARGIRFIISRYSSAEGTNRHVSPHVFRHTFATAMIGAGADIRTVQEMLGHSSISTTQRYTHVTTAQLKALYNCAHPHGTK